MDASDSEVTVGKWLRYANELRRCPAQQRVVRIVVTGYAATPHSRPKPAKGQAVSRIDAADGGSIAVWPAGGGPVAIEVEATRRTLLGPPPRDGGIRPVVSQGILVPADDAARMARSLRSGSGFYFAEPGAAIGSCMWRDSAPPDTAHDCAVLVGSAAALLLAGLVESAIAAGQWTPTELALFTALSQEEYDEVSRYRPAQAGAGRNRPASAPLEIGDPFAGARKRTDENLRRAFGGDPALDDD